MGGFLKNKRILYAAFFIVAVLLFFSSVLIIKPEGTLRTAERDVAPYFKMFDSYRPDIFLPSVTLHMVSGGGADVILPDSRRYTLLNLWATWCSPCLKELPSIKRLAKHLKQDDSWHVLAVSVDSPLKMKAVNRFVERYDIREVASYHDSEFKLQTIFNPQVLPATYIISPSGQVLYEIKGDAEWDDPQIITFLEMVEKHR